MEEYTWLFNRRDYSGLASSFLFSVLFHVLLFAILASTSIYYPLTGDAEKIDVVWLYPSFLLGGQSEPAGQVDVPAMKEPVVTPSPTRVEALSPAEKVEPARVAPVKEPAHGAVTELPPRLRPADAAVAEPVVTVPPIEEAEPETEPEMKIPAAIVPPPEVMAEKPQVEKPDKKVARTPEPEKAPPPVPVPVPVPAVEAPKKPFSPVKEMVAEKVAAPVAPQPVKETVRPKGEKLAVAPMATSRPQPAESPAPRRESTPVAKEPQPSEKKEAVSVPAPAPPVAPAERKAAQIAPQPAPAPAPKPAAVAKPEGEVPPKTAEVKGLFLPPLIGDLKLEMTGRDDAVGRIKVTVLFREFLKARRTRPLSRSEARRVQALAPKVARTGDRTLQAVIEVAGEGVYEFVAEADSAQSIETSCAIKLYEKSSRARTKSVGTRRIGRREGIVKVLMPEGIFWDDDAAFSGSMEDSDSVTKFDAETGLVWKEYK